MHTINYSLVRQNNVHWLQYWSQYSSKWQTWKVFATITFNVLFILCLIWKVSNNCSHYFSSVHLQIQWRLELMTVSPLDRTEQQLVSVDKGPKITNHLKHSANTLTPLVFFHIFWCYNQNNQCILLRLYRASQCSGREIMHGFQLKTNQTSVKYIFITFRQPIVGSSLAEIVAAASLCWIQRVQQNKSNDEWKKTYR